MSVTDVTDASAPTTCDVNDVVVTDGVAATRLPAPGEHVSVDVLTTTGARHLTVARDQSGAIRISPTDAGPGAISTSSACGSSAYNRAGYRWTTTYQWWYNSSNVAAGVYGRAEDDLRAATTNITQGHNDCGMTGRPRAYHSYRGRTTTRPQLSTSGACTGNDGRNVTGWGTINSTTILAVTCTYHNGGRALASDALINTRFRWTDHASGCTNAWDLTSVMTHERGHTFGLGHSSADTASTMYPSIAACTFGKRTLGRGDLRGLLDLYGRR
ncbi:matrixin family metalloprotease [Micromonospora sp. NPDC050980]|uniref:matrixin family metalloprotease n=1 Tax=Micromonospora sp. NPDC050980 TaxID=3155161 RepID=UPI0033CA5589